MGTAASKPVATSPNRESPIFNEKTQSVVAPSGYENYEDLAVEDDSDLASVSPLTLKKWDKTLEQDPALSLAKLVLSNSDPLGSLINRNAFIKDEKVFNINLKGVDAKGDYPGPRVNQAASGRCWLFATTNVIRYNVIEVAKLGDFQLSQSYLFFYDKLEKANFYLETILELVDEPMEGRLMSYLNQAPMNDGGQWDMAYNILEKYGAVPQTLYPESFSSSASRTLDTLLTSKLREYALILRHASKTKKSSSLRAMKSAFLAEVYNTLAITLGTPPKPDDPLTWDYYDRDGKYHSWSGSPKEFYSTWCRRKGMDPKDSFSMVNDPRNDYEKVYTVKKLGNVWGARPVKYVNVETDVLEDAVIAGIKANTPLFFGCDVGKSSERSKGIMDTTLYDVKAAFGYSLGMNKAQRLITGDSSATHAMVITAVHVDDSGRPVKYKVENSWSDAAGEKGWFMMSAEWFRQYVYQVVVPRSIVDKKYSELWDNGELNELEPWDPMVRSLLG